MTTGCDFLFYTVQITTDQREKVSWIRTAHFLCDDNDQEECSLTGVDFKDLGNFFPANSGAYGT